MRIALLVFALGCSSSAKPPDPTPPPPIAAAPQPDAAEPAPEPLPDNQPITHGAPPQDSVAHSELVAGATAAKPKSQAEIAAANNAEGIELVKAKKYAEASAKFRDAVARVPMPGYFFNLCVSLYQEGKFGEALTSCGAIEHNNPTTEMRAKAEKLIERIRAEVKRQGIK